MRRISMVFAAALLCAPTIFISAEQPAFRKPSAGLELTIDNIMRGPDLVGYPPTALRWSGDSQKLYFEWRKPGEEEASTYSVGRNGGTPEKLTDDQTKNIPSANGRWDKARRRVLFVDDGDVVVVDTQTGARRQITRTAGGEGNPRWARNETPSPSCATATSSSCRPSQVPAIC